jgi:hypothetical protein
VLNHLKPRRFTDANGIATPHPRRCGRNPPGEATARGIRSGAIGPGRLGAACACASRHLPPPSWLNRGARDRGVEMLLVHSTPVRARGSTGGKSRCATW